MHTKSYKKRSIAIMIVLCCTLVLVGCGAKAPEQEELPPAKDPFYIQTTSLQDITEDFTLKKAGVINGASSITVSAQVGGRVQNIRAKEGQNVAAGQSIVQLIDTTGNFSFALKRSENALKLQESALEQNTLQLDTAINNAQLAYDRALEDFTLTKAQNTLSKLQVQVQTASGDNRISSAQLELDNIQAQIDKSRFDYETQLAVNQQTIQTYDDNLAIQFQDVQNLFDSVLTDIDLVMGVSSVNQNKDVRYRQYLGGRNLVDKEEIEEDLKELLDDRDDFLKETYDLEKFNSRQDVINYLIRRLDNLKEIVDGYQLVLNLSIPNQVVLPQTQINAWINQAKGLDAQILAKDSVLASQASSINTFFSTYENNQESLEKSIELLENQRDITERRLRDAESSTILGIMSSLNAAQFARDSAAQGLSTAKRTKAVTLSGLELGIEQAKISYDEALSTIAKLSNTSPIAGTIATVLVEKGQEVGPGTPLFSVVATREQKVEIFLSDVEKQAIQVGQEVTVMVGDTKTKGKITAVSDVANQLLQYKITIDMRDASQALGGIYIVHIPLSQEGKTWLPLSYMKIIEQGVGQLSVREGGDIVTKEILLGETRNDYVEVISYIPPVWKIITTTTENYDANIHYPAQG